MELWKKFSEVLITHFLRIGNNAKLKVEATKGTFTTVTPAQVAALSGNSTGLAALVVNLLSVGAGGIETGLTAHAGGTQAAALALSTTKSFHEVTTVGSAADSVALPAATGSGNIHWVKNSAAANSMQVYGQATETIDGVASATGVAVAAGKSRAFIDSASGKWQSLLGA